MATSYSLKPSITNVDSSGVVTIKFTSTIPAKSRISYTLKLYKALDTDTSTWELVKSRAISKKTVLLEGESLGSFYNGTIKMATGSTYTKLYKVKVVCSRIKYYTNVKKAKFNTGYKNKQSSDTYTMDNNHGLTTPSAPTITSISATTVQLSLANIDTTNSPSKIQFQYSKYTNDGAGKGTSTAVDVAIQNRYVQHIYSNIETGYFYMFRARAYSSSYARYSSWSDWSEVLYTPPAKPVGSSITWTSIDASSGRLSWDKVTGADSYKIQLAKDTNYFGTDYNATEVTSETNYTVISDLAAGKWYVRILATSEGNLGGGDSDWSNVSNFIMLTKPYPPTIWSSTTKLAKGDDLYLYVTPNSEDGAAAQVVKIFINDGTSTRAFNVTNIQNKVTNIYNAGTVTIKAFGSDLTDYEKDSVVDARNTLGYYMSSRLKAGDTIKWQAATYSLKNDNNYLSDYSAAAEYVIYEKAVLSVSLYNSGEQVPEASDVITDGGTCYKVAALPVTIVPTYTPASILPVGYTVKLTSVDDVESASPDGTSQWYAAGTTIYSKYYEYSSDLEMTISPSDVGLTDGNIYRLTVTVTNAIGHKASADLYFVTDIGGFGTNYMIEATDFAMDENYYTVSFVPACRDISDFLTRRESDEDVDLEDCQTTTPEDVTLSVYRVNVDGTATLIASDLTNGRTTVTDIHPSLFKQTYRIVATSTSNGSIVYEDLEIGEDNYPLIIIQWNESSNLADDISVTEIVNDDGTKSLEYTVDDEVVNPTEVFANMIILKYNIECSESYSMDTSLVEYIGREHPVGYYGTQLGETASWSADIPKSDHDTISMLRKLNRYGGDVYVRNQYGIGYWAQASASWSQSYDSMIISVSISINRVEGGA